MDDRKYTVSEAVRLIGVESHVLRYWEEELNIVVERSAQGHRLYSEQNITHFRQIRHLKECGLQLKAIRMLFQGETFLGDTGVCTEPCTGVEAGVCTGVEAGMCTGVEAGVCTGADTGMEVCEIIPAETPEDQSAMLVAVLRRMMKEVVEEQNDYLEQRIADCIRAELQNEFRDRMDEFDHRYRQAVREAAAGHISGRKKSRLRSLLEHLNK